MESCRRFKQLRPPAHEAEIALIADRHYLEGMIEERDLCEVRSGQGWKRLKVSVAIDMPFKPALQCPECHGPVKPHKQAINGMRAHFEHITLHPGCSRGSDFDGQKRRHADALA